MESKPEIELVLINGHVFQQYAGMPEPRETGHCIYCNQSYASGATLFESQSCKRSPYQKLEMKYIIDTDNGKLTARIENKLSRPNGEPEYHPKFVRLVLKLLLQRFAAMRVQLEDNERICNNALNALEKSPPPSPEIK